MGLDLKSERGQLRLLRRDLSFRRARLLATQVVARHHDGAESGPGHDRPEEGDIGRAQVAKIEKMLAADGVVVGQQAEIGRIQHRMKQADDEAEGRGAPEPDEGARFRQATQHDPHA
ncbi:hypothetical protein D3C80_1806690 [compost metagenome]